MIVAKFGGTSIQDGPALERVAGVVRKRRVEGGLVLVFSAMGKTTDVLLETAELASRGMAAEARERLLRLRRYHLTQVDCVPPGEECRQLRAAQEELFRELEGFLGELARKGGCSPEERDAVASYGERLSSLILASFLRSQGLPVRLLDSRELIRTSADFTAACVLEEETFPRLRKALLPLLQEGRIPLLQGFIGSTPQGRVTTLGRGGSDLTAAVVGAALGAKAIEIWTDVPGVLSADPRLVPNPYRVRRLSFEEAAELAYFGARILHPTSLLPAAERNIPVLVCDSARPGEEGTIISAEAPLCPAPVKSIACKGGITIITVHSTRMLLAWGFLRRLFEVFERHKTAVDVVATSEVKVSLTVDCTRALGGILEELREFGQTQVQSGMAIICVVGDQLKYRPGVAARIFEALKEINVEMISQGASSINLTLLVREEHMGEAVNRLHRALLKDPDPRFFLPSLARPAERRC